MRGRNRKPIEQHMIDGTYRPDRHGPIPDDVATFAPPVKPEDLDGEAGELWDRLTKLLAGVVRDRDAEQLVELCRWWATLQRVRESLDAAQPGSLRYGRLMNQASTASAAFDRIASRFGLTPADRAKFNAESPTAGKPKVATRPKTKLDQQGPPKKGK